MMRNMEWRILYYLLFTSVYICDGFSPLAFEGIRISGHERNNEGAIISSRASSTDSSDLMDDSYLESPDDYTLHWLDLGAEDEYYDSEGGEDGITASLGLAIGRGEVVMCLPDMASSSDCQALFAAGMEACQRRGSASRGRTRMSVSDPTCFSNEIVLQCDEILLRILDYIDEEIPSIYKALFEPSAEWLSRQPLNAYLEQPTVPPLDHLADTCDGLRELYMMGELEWSEGEPAINVYESSGYFGAHKDHLALTVLIPLTAAESDFTGGGTGFWSGNRDVDENPQTEPDLVLRPPPGSALIFGGDVTHAGLPVEAGYRSVFVCSFSTRTPASSEDRLHGLQAPPQVSPNFKGTL